MLVLLMLVGFLAVAEDQRTWCTGGPFPSMEASCVQWRRERALQGGPGCVPLVEGGRVVAWRCE